MLEIKAISTELYKGKLQLIIETGIPAHSPQVCRSTELQQIYSMCSLARARDGRGDRNRCVWACVFYYYCCWHFMSLSDTAHLPYGSWEWAHSGPPVVGLYLNELCSRLVACHSLWSDVLPQGSWQWTQAPIHNIVFKFICRCVCI